jgi:sec-independent protein translocase protein TatA
MLGTTEILVIAGVVLVLFGGAAIPRFARSLGKARKEFQGGMEDGAREADEEAGKEKAAAGKKKGEKQA